MPAEQTRKRTRRLASGFEGDLGDGQGRLRKQGSRPLKAEARPQLVGSLAKHFPKHPVEVMLREAGGVGGIDQPYGVFGGSLH